MSAGPPRATGVRRAHDGAVQDQVTLAYEDRLIRRRRLLTEGGAAVLADLPSALSLDEGDALELEDGRLVGVRAASEALLEVRGASPGDLARLAWHVGNRHAPAQIEAHRLLVRREAVMAAMLRGLGATVTEVEAPFVPEGGAYGEGRVMGHSHGPSHGEPDDPLGLAGLAHDPT